MKNYIEFSEATEIAKKRNANYNKCEEYTDAWFFYFNDGEIHFGGGNTGLVVEKDGGNVLMPYEYFMDGSRTFESTGKEYDI